MMKKAVIILGVIIELISQGVIYSQALQVVSITDNIVTLETKTGYTFEVENTGDMITGELYSCIFYNNLTSDTITDDVILDYRYTGFEIQ